MKNITFIYIYIYKYKIHSRDDPGSSVWASNFFWAGCPGLFLEYSYGPGSGLFAIPLPVGRTGPDGLGRQAQRTGAAVAAAAVVLRQ